MAAHTLEEASKMRSRRLAVLGIGLLFAVSTGCEAQKQSPTPGASGAPGPTGSVAPASQGVGNDGSITMMIANFGNEIWVPKDSDGVGGAGTLVQAYLIETDGKGGLIPGVAESYSSSTDGKVWTFKIRKGIKFQDGTDLTAADVQFTLNNTFGPEGKTSINGSTVAVAENTEKIEVTDPDTVAWTLTAPMPFLPALLSSGSTGDEGAVIPKAYYDKVGADGYNRNPIGAGPMKVTQYTPGVSVSLERFDGYYMPDRLPSIKTLDLKLVPELATRAIALSNGDADVIQADLPAFDQITSAGGSLAIAPEASYVWIMLPGCWKPELPCHDVRVRQALDLAVDKEKIMKALYGDLWENKGWQYVAPSSLGYSAELAPSAYDPAKAKQLLADAGFPEGKDFPVLEVNATNADAISGLPDLALLIGQAWLENLGIHSEIRIGDAATMRDRWRGRELDGQIFIRSNEARFDGGDITRSLYGNADSRTRQAEDPAYYALVDQAEAVLDQAARGAAYNKVYLQLREGHYEIASGLLGQAWGLGPKVASWQPWPLLFKPSAIWTLKLK
jgi:ABC-type transport system substrate-binding protein